MTCIFVHFARNINTWSRATFIHFYDKLETHHTPSFRWFFFWSFMAYANIYPFLTIWIRFNAIKNSFATQQNHLKMHSPQFCYWWCFHSVSDSIKTSLFHYTHTHSTAHRDTKRGFHFARLWSSVGKSSYKNFPFFKRENWLLFFFFIHLFMENLFFFLQTKLHYSPKACLEFELQVE